MSAVGAAWRGRAQRVALAAASALAYALAVQADALWWLLLVAWVPWLWMLEDLEPRAALVYGTLTGIAATHTTHLWMFEPLVDYVFPPFGIDGAAAFGDSARVWSNLALTWFSIWQGLMWGIAGGILVWLRRLTGLGVTWLAPSSVALVEAAYPDLFPTTLVTPLAVHPWWIQLAELGGVAAVTFAVFLINAVLLRTIVELRQSRRERRRVERRTLLLVFGVTLGVPGYGAIRMAMVDAAVEAADVVPVGVVQGNFGIATARTHRAAILREHQRMTTKLSRQGAQLVVWGETAYPFPGFYLDSTRAPARGNRRVLRRLVAPLVFGTRTRELAAQSRSPARSSVWVLQADGTLGERYDKMHPLPMIEEPRTWGEHGGYNPYQIMPGESARALEVSGYRLGPLLGHEDLLPGAARDTAREGVHVLVSLANESWFGASRAHTDHLRLASFRAVEHRRGLVRVANAGISAYIDPAGRVVERTTVSDADREGFERATGFVTEVAMMSPDSRTPYTRFPLGFPLLLVVVTVGAAHRRRKRA